MKVWLYAAAAGAGLVLLGCGCGSGPPLPVLPYCTTTTLDPLGSRNRIFVQGLEAPIVSYEPRRTVVDFPGPSEVKGEDRASYSRDSTRYVPGRLRLVLGDGTLAVDDRCTE